MHATLNNPDDLTPTAFAFDGHDDRRGHKRFLVARPGKIFRRSTQQYAPMTTRNLSFGGALVAVEADRPFSVGEIIDVGVSYGRHQVVPTDKLVRGIVVRVERLEPGRQNLAVRYIQPVGAAAAA
ncbi:MAG: PilZ domain-containing protein [Phycisphaerales bacterium]|nr:PilZ domain-containing protein [Phycisphaerales bacterium]